MNPEFPMVRSPFVFLRQMVGESCAPRVSLMVICTALATLLESSTPLAFQNVVDGLGQSRGKPAALTWFIVLLLLAAGSMILYRVYQWLAIDASANLRMHAQCVQIANLLDRSPASFRSGGGALVESIKRSSYSCVLLVQLLTFDVVHIVVVVINLGFILAFADSHYALLVCAWLVIYIAGSALFARRCLSFGSGQFSASAQSAEQINDVLRNFETVFNYGAVDREHEFLRTGLHEEQRRTRALRQYVWSTRIFGSIAVFTLFAVMTATTFQDVMEGTRTVGAFALVFTATNILIMTVFGLSEQLINFYENLGSLDSALDCLTQNELPPQVAAASRESVRSLDGNERCGEIELRSVTFAYPGEAPLFENFSLTIGTGRKLALVGPSGAGKTTLLRLILGHLPLDAGQILIDGIDIRNLGRAALSERFAVVSQQTGLFNRTLRENVAYGLPDATDEMIADAVRSASAENFIKRRGLGLHSIAGVDGIQFSGGERQRLSLARALLKSDKSVLMLDEATSALDSAAEQEIQEAIATAMAGRTVIAIAHRISTIMDMDEIIYLDHGRILERGSHADLLAKRGQYFAAWSRQGRHSLRLEDI